MTQRTDFITPVGRLVSGSLYKPNLTDAEGKPLVVKSGPNAGQPRQDFYFALAIPKGAEQHWSQTPWGATIFRAGQLGHPQAHQSPTYAWKCKDGSSTVPNRKGKKPCDQAGFPGNWILSFSSGYAPKVVREKGTVPMLDVDAVNLGDWVEVFGSVGDNGSQQQPGVFLNHSIVNFVGYGERIATGVDAASVGFGQSAVPAGVSAVPMGTGFVAPPALPGVPPVAAAAPAMVPPVAVAPNPAFLMPQAPAIPVAPPAAPAHRMTAKAGGAPYESFIAQNWTDPALVQHGYMEA